LICDIEPRLILYQRANLLSFKDNGYFNGEGAQKVSVFLPVSDPLMILAHICRRIGFKPLCSNFYGTFYSAQSWHKLRKTSREEASFYRCQSWYLSPRTPGKTKVLCNASCSVIHCFLAWWQNPFLFVKSVCTKTNICKHKCS